MFYFKSEELLHTSFHPRLKSDEIKSDKGKVTEVEITVRDFVGSKV